ncbi:uncharacterized protein KY384_002069 [Bacidia gigantensis]|uniref:uncharacterized protein n=1 Tax=Bacidia gigantensis TaxID=2732470 RepID=UPI001D0471A2|nr:uncharacterized protein KY384_002069 [Bacidia gigantensis]KAG8533286.1 hypothetical protein KY384_002069 [Bacidia gigantensis]
MPEIGEGIEHQAPHVCRLMRHDIVARIVHFLRKHLAGKTLAKVATQTDENVYGKVGCSAEAFETSLTGKKVLDAKQQGKYFWLEMSSPPHPLMHFGMAGWLKIKGDDTAYYKPQKSEGPEEWPPKYWKFILQAKEEPRSECAYVDFRRFGRIRLIDCDASDIRRVEPLVKNGPDPVQDATIVTVKWLKDKVQSKRIPIKALLLDQANISGIGNWVGDELLYDAKIHPEQYSNTLSEPQIAQLHKSMHYVCKLSVDTLADSSKFPEEWLFKHRWGKGKKDSMTTLPNGKRVEGDVKAEAVDDANGATDNKTTKKPKAASRATPIQQNGEKGSPTAKKTKRSKRAAESQEDLTTSNGFADSKDVEEPASKKKKISEKSNKNEAPNSNGAKSDGKGEDTGRRRSTRVSGRGL